MGSIKGMIRQPKNIVALLSRIVMLGVSRLVGLPLTFFGNVLIARAVGPDHYGIYMTYLSLALAAASFSVLGVDKIGTREIAREEPSHRVAVMVQISKWAISTNSLIFLSICLIVDIAMKANIGIPVASNAMVAVTDLTILGYSIMIVMCGYLVGFKKITAAQSLDNLFKNLVLFITIAFCAVLGLRPSILTLMNFQLFGYLTGVIAGGLLLFLTIRKIPQDHRPAVKDVDVQKSWRKTSFYFFIASAAVVLMGRLDVVIVTMVGSAHDAGLFGAANRLAQIGNVIPMILMAQLQPELSASSKRGYELTRKTIKNARIFSFVVAVLVILPMIVLAKMFLSLMGHGFTPATLCLQIILLGYFAVSLSIPDSTFLIMSGWEKYSARLTWMQFIVTTILTFFLVRRLGATGGAMAYAAGTILFAVGAHLISRKALRELRDGKPRLPL